RTEVLRCTACGHLSFGHSTIPANSPVFVSISFLDRLLVPLHGRLHESHRKAHVTGSTQRVPVRPTFASYIDRVLDLTSGLAWRRRQAASAKAMASHPTPKL